MMVRMDMTYEDALQRPQYIIRRLSLLLPLLLLSLPPITVTVTVTRIRPLNPEKPNDLAPRPLARVENDVSGPFGELDE